MSRSFSYDVSLSEPPAEAHARLREAVTERILASADMRPAGEQADSMAFRPNWGWPLLVALSRRARGESINLRFSATALGTSVAVSGKVAGRAESVANREFWTQTLIAA